MRRFLPSLSLLVCITLLGCSAEIKEVSRASLDLARDLAGADSLATVPPVEVAGGTSAVPAVQLYIDASQSMAGYVGCRAGTTEFDRILDRIANDLGAQHVTLFGSSAGSASPTLVMRPLDHAIHCPETYSFTQNPDDRLFTAFAADSTDATFLYFTDGVQSDVLAATPSPSVAALQRWLGSGHALAIMAFRSQFSGRLWSEELGRWVDNVKTDQRPFYVLLLARSEATLNVVLERITPGVRANATTFRFGTRGVVCRFRRQVNVYTEDTGVGWFFIDPSAYARFTNSAEPLGSYNCSIPPEHPLGAIGARINVSYRRWDGTSFSNESGIPAGANLQVDSALFTTTGSEATIRATFPVDDPLTRFGFYQITLTPVPAAVRPVVEELTTESDRSLESADQTYRFGWLIEHLIRFQFQSMVHPMSIFVTVQDGN